MSLSPTPTDTTTRPTRRPFGVEAEAVPSGALGILAGLLRDDLDRLRRRTKRDGHAAGVKAAAYTLELFIDALDREAEQRDWRRNQEGQE